MKHEVLRMIRETDSYISGQEISEKLGVSRTAVWKVIEVLRAEGYDIEAVQNRGYHLVCYPELMTGTEIMSRVKTSWAGTKVYYRKETASTNEDAKDLADDGATHGSLVVTEYQSGGKGRRGRVWTAEKGSTVAMSLILKPDFSPSKASRLTLLMALAVAEVIHHITDLDVKIKWPNDIIVNGKKVCGILTEMSAEPDYINYVIIGVGINVNNTEFPDEIKETATSLLNEKGDRVGRTDLIVGIMDFFEYYYNVYEENQDIADFVDLYESYLVNKDKEVRVLDPKGEYKGIAQGINDNGELIVQKEDGSFVRVDSGEVSVRGVLGYV